MANIREWADKEHRSVVLVFVANLNANAGNWANGRGVGSSFFLLLALLSEIPYAHMIGMGVSERFLHYYHLLPFVVSLAAIVL